MPFLTNPCMWSSHKRYGLFYSWWFYVTLFNCLSVCALFKACLTMCFLMTVMKATSWNVALHTARLQILAIQLHSTWWHFHYWPFHNSAPLLFPSPATFPSCVLEISSDEVDEYYSPKDFKLGQRIKLMSRSFLLYDCDSFTKEYYEKNYPEIELKPVELPKKIDKLLERKKVRN